MAPANRLYRIGELAELSGVPSKTIRFYSDSGLLPPTAVTGAGYRLYSDPDRARLELVRALRDIGLDLNTIGKLLRSQVPATDALALQLEAVEVGLRALQRQRTLLRAALARGESGALSYLDHARAVLRLDALDRQRFLAGQMARAFEDVPADPDWRASFWQAAVLDLPNELDDEQLAAWLELAEIMSDADFIRRLNAMGRAAWTGDVRTGQDGQVVETHEPVDARAAPGEHGEVGGPRHERKPAASLPGRIMDVYREAIAAMQAGVAPESPAGQAVVDHFLGSGAGTDAACSPQAAAQALAELERHSDPRAARYWELVAILKRWETPPYAAAHRWLVEGLRWRAASAAEAR